MRNTDILIVDDEIGIREVLKETLEDEGYTVALAENAEQARHMRKQIRPAMVLLDIWMPDSDGITLLKEWGKNGQLNMPVVMMSGHGSIETAVEATKFGALDFLEKPITLQKLRQTVERALKYSETQTLNNFALDNLGKAPVIQELQKHIETALQQSAPILLIGESGSPFETVARAFHQPNTAWVYPNRVENITNIPAELLNQASGGVLYLGDVSQYDKTTQQSIAFLISKAERHHTRIICCSSVPLNELFSGCQHDPNILRILSSLIIHIPPLRQQAEDIDFLIKRILSELTQHQNLAPTYFHTAAIAQLRQYNWPGNLEQLKNVVSNLALNSETHEITEKEVLNILNQFHPDIECSELQDGFNFNLPLRELREQLERRYFEYHIRKEQGNMSHVAIKVGLERTHLYRKLKQLGIHFTRRCEKD